jgi:hypothetical protein
MYSTTYVSLSYLLRGGPTRMRYTIVTRRVKCRFPRARGHIDSIGVPAGLELQ